MKIDRLMSIVLVLLDKERISAQELADMFEVSLRTIYRDIDAIELAGISIRSTSGVGGGFEIMPKYKLEKKVFSAAELTTILMGLTSLSNMLHEDELIHALSKIKSFIPADKTNEIELKMNQIHIDLSQWNASNSSQPYIEMIRLALAESRLLSFDYIAHHGKRSARIVEAYQLVWKSSHWYLYGYCYSREDFRLFRLSRISHMQIQAATFHPRDYPKPQLALTDAITVIQTDIKIRIHHSIMDRVLDYCTFECFSWEDEEHYLVTFPFIENDYYYDILLSFGDKCECLSPTYIRTEMMHRTKKILSLYDERASIS